MGNISSPLPPLLKIFLKHPTKHFLIPLAQKLITVFPPGTEMAIKQDKEIIYPPQNIEARNQPPPKIEQ